MDGIQQDETAEERGHEILDDDSGARDERRDGLRSGIRPRFVDAGDDKHAGRTHRHPRRLVIVYGAHDRQYLRLVREAERTDLPRRRLQFGFDARDDRHRVHAAIIT